MINEKNIQELQVKIYEIPTIYEWTFSGFSGRHATLFRLIISIVIPSILPIVFFIASNVSVPSLDFWILLSLFLVGFLLTRYLILPDRTYHYHLTSIGIHYSEQVAVPDSAYTFVRGFAWVGIAVCIVALIFIGPLAFVGVGGCALLSFGLTKFSPEIVEKEVYFSEQLIIFDPIKDTLLDLATGNTDHPKFDRTIFFRSFDDKKKVLDRIRECHQDVEYHLLEHINDQYKHPIFNRDPQNE